MNILTTVLSTVLIVVNIFMISAIAWATRSMKDKNSRMGGRVILFTLIADVLGIAGGLFL